MTAAPKRGGDEVAAIKPLLCLDFDGVIHSYASGWQGAGIVQDDEVPGAIDFVIRALQTFDVAIFSSRSKSLSGRRAMKRWMYARLVVWEWNDAENYWREFINVSPDWTPFTHGDVDELHRDLARATLKRIQWPWFKPAAFLTIDDRALTFDGTWPEPDTLRAFKPWNKRHD